MDTIQIQGALEIDQDRGVIYFHSLKTGHSPLRICSLPTPIPNPSEYGMQLDVTHVVGASWNEKQVPHSGLIKPCKSGRMPFSQFLIDKGIKYIRRYFYSRNGYTRIKYYGIDKSKVDVKTVQKEAIKHFGLQAKVAILDAVRGSYCDSLTIKIKA